MKDFILLLPELFLALTVAGLIFSEIGYHGEKVRLMSAIALLGLGGAFAQAVLTGAFEPTRVFGGILSVDPLALFFKFFFILLAAMTVMGSFRSREIPEDRRSEYLALVVAGTLAMCLMASVSDLLFAFLCLQFLNIVSHFLVAFGTRNLSSTEAAIKHLVFAGVAGALLLFGSALLFSATHSTKIYEIHQLLSQNPLAQPSGSVIFVLLFLAVSFQIAAAPMSIWAPDVLQGAPTPVAAFLSIGSRAAGFAFAIRLIWVVFAEPSQVVGQWKVMGGVDWPKFVGWVAGLTLSVGALLSLRQTSVKRLISYLLIAQTGFLLLGFLVLDEGGLAALFFQILVELFSVMGVATIVSQFVDELHSDQIEDWKGLMARAVPESLALILFLAALVGIPPLSGSIAKFTLIGIAFERGWPALAGLALLSWAFCGIAVFRVSYGLISDFRSEKRPSFNHGWLQRSVLFGFLLPIILIGLFADRVIGWSLSSLRQILW
jgi:proton-translocating NADH-quinone oxidoreductase chain N